MDQLPPAASQNPGVQSGHRVPQAAVASVSVAGGCGHCPVQARARTCPPPGGRLGHPTTCGPGNKTTEFSGDVAPGKEPAGANCSHRLQCQSCVTGGTPGEKNRSGGTPGHGASGGTPRRGAAAGRASLGTQQPGAAAHCGGSLASGKGLPHTTCQARGRSFRAGGEDALASSSPPTPSPQPPGAPLPSGQPSGAESRGQRGGAESADSFIVCPGCPAGAEGMVQIDLRDGPSTRPGRGAVSIPVPKLLCAQLRPDHPTGHRQGVASRGTPRPRVKVGGGGLLAGFQPRLPRGPVGPLARVSLEPDWTPPRPSPRAVVSDETLTNLPERVAGERPSRVGSIVSDYNNMQVGPVAREEPPHPAALSGWSQQRPIKLLWALAPGPADQPCEFLLRRPPAHPSSEGQARPGKRGAQPVQGASPRAAADIPPQRGAQLVQGASPRAAADIQLQRGAQLVQGASPRAAADILLLPGYIVLVGGLLILAKVRVPSPRALPPPDDPQQQGARPATTCCFSTGRPLKTSLVTYSTVSAATAAVSAPVLQMAAPTGGQKPTAKSARSPHAQAWKGLSRALCPHPRSAVLPPGLLPLSWTPGGSLIRGAEPEVGLPQPPRMISSPWLCAAASCCQLGLGPAGKATSVLPEPPDRDTGFSPPYRTLTSLSLLWRRIVLPSVGSWLNPHQAGGSPSILPDHPPADCSSCTLRPPPPGRAFLSPEPSPLTSLAPTSPAQGSCGTSCAPSTLGKRPEDSSAPGSPSRAPQPGHGPQCGVTPGLGREKG
ncbi:collagen alpha-1(III) chain-like [Moschus berezovskii]|uniref:collagen alpha-1(III) chain-like n=1 Tax=Moschus berezovskii TaxID=68408 RepID=UPI0024441611|nr:collagen alpha-1(III) chain-like [Moschus berezovskii]